VPRVLFDSWSSEDFATLFSSEREHDLCSQTLIQFLQVCVGFSISLCLANKHSMCNNSIVFSFISVCCTVSLCWNCCNKCRLVNIDVSPIPYRRYFLSVDKVIGDTFEKKYRQTYCRYFFGLNYWKSYRYFWATCDLGESLMFKCFELGVACKLMSHQPPLHVMLQGSNALIPVAGRLRL